MRRIESPNLVLLLSFAVIFMVSAAPAMAAEEKSECPLELNSDAGESEAPVVDPPLELEVANQSDQVLNFGDGRGVKTDEITLRVKDSGSLPKSVQAEHFQFITEQPMKRIGSDSLESTRLQPLTFSKPEIVDNRKRIKFTICVSAENGEPGTYTGQVLLSGPLGLSSTTLTQTAQLKTKEGTFLLILIVILLAVGVLLWWKTNLDLEGKKQKTRIGLIVISLASVGAAMYQIYNDNPAWGADKFASALALLGTALAAAGLGSTVSGLVQQFGGSPNPDPIEDPPAPPPPAPPPPEPEPDKP